MMELWYKSKIVSEKGGRWDRKSYSLTVRQGGRQRGNTPESIPLTRIFHLSKQGWSHSSPELLKRLHSVFAEIVKQVDMKMAKGTGDGGFVCVRVCVCALKSLHIGLGSQQRTLNLNHV